MSAKILAIDIDGCLANFTKAYGHLLIEVGGNRLPEGWETNTDFPPTWQWERYYGYPTEVETEVWVNRIHRNKKFWETLEPLPDAREVLHRLNGPISSGKAEVYFITHRAGDSAKLQTEKWLYEHGCNWPTVFMTGDKAPWLKLLKANFFVDDKLETYNAVARAWHNEKWDWDFRMYLKDAPYNRDNDKQRRSFGPRLHVAASVKEALYHAGLWQRS